MKTYSIFISLLLVISSVFAQEVNDNQEIVSSSGASLYSFDKTDNTVIGSPYIQETFLPARVSAKTGNIYNLRYNAVNDEMEMESQQTKNPTINKNISGLIVTFLKDNRTYYSMKYLTKDGNKATGFLVSISDSNANIKLFLKERIAFFQGKPAKSSYQAAKPAKFDRVDDEYYIVINDEIAKSLSNNKKDIAALFPNHENDILNYISAEKLNLRKQNDLVKLVGYLNQLKK